MGAVARTLTRCCGEIGLWVALILFGLGFLMITGAFLLSVYGYARHLLFRRDQYENLDHAFMWIVFSSISLGSLFVLLLLAGTSRGQTIAKIGLWVLGGGLALAVTEGLLSGDLLRKLGVGGPRPDGGSARWKIAGKDQDWLGYVRLGKLLIHEEDIQEANPQPSPGMTVEVRLSREEEWRLYTLGEKKHYSRDGTVLQIFEIDSPN